MRRYTVLFWLNGVEHEVSKVYVIDHASAPDAFAAIRKIQTMRSVSFETACAIPSDAMFGSDCTWLRLPPRKAVR